MTKKIEVNRIDTSEAEKNFSKLLIENKTFFLNGTWGSGKSEFLRNVENKTDKKIIYLDLWNVKDNRTVMNIVFYKLTMFKEYVLKLITVLCVITSILMSDVVNLGIASSLGLSNSHILLQLAGFIALFVATFQVFKIQSDNIFVSLLSKISMKDKVLIIDDFDRVNPEKQEEAYKAFNILNGRLPIVFVGDYTKIANNKDNYLQKIIDRQIELPYVLHPQSIWNEYFNRLEEILDFKINNELKELIIEEKRNLREQHHFNDYINLEFIDKKKLGHVQVNQQLIIIYIYLFHNNLYQLLLDNWTPEFKLPENNNNRLHIPNWSDNAIFNNNTEKVIDHVLESNNDYPVDYKKNKQGYYVFETINNLSISKAKEILLDEDMLKKYLINDGEIGADFYRYLIFIYNKDKLKDNPELLDSETQKRINNTVFGLLLEEKYSPLLSRLSVEIYDEWSSSIDLMESLKEKDEKAIKYFEDNYLQSFDLSQKVHFFLDILKSTGSEAVYSYYMDEISEIIKSNELYENQKNKPYLISMLTLNNRRHWIYIEEWSELIFKRINELSDNDFVEFWSIYRMIDLKSSNGVRINISDIHEIVITKVSNDEYGNPVTAYDHIIEIFEERLREISSKNNITVKYNKELP